MYAEIAIDVFQLVLISKVAKIVSELMAKRKALAVEMLVWVHSDDHISALPHNRTEDVVVCRQLHLPDPVMIDDFFQ